jgi:hypothetical protein
MVLRLDDRFEFPPPQSHAGRRWIATRSLADATGIGCETVRRPPSGRRTTATTVDSESVI